MPLILLEEAIHALLAEICEQAFEFPLYGAEAAVIAKF